MRGGPRRAEILLLAGGAGLVASAFLHWVRRGPGRTLRGHDLVDALVGLGNHVPGLSAARLTVLWYLVPALGAGVWVAVGLAGPGHRATRAVALAAALGAGLAVAAFARLAGVGDLGPGAGLAAASALTLAAARRHPAV